MNNCYAPRRRKASEAKEGDGAQRGATELRPVYAEVSIVADADGSAYIELAHTKVAASVRVRQLNKSWQDFRDEGQLLCDVRFSLSAIGGSRGDEDQEKERGLGDWLSGAIEASIQLERLPKMVVEVYAEIIQGDGGIMAALANCVTLALADAGVEMYALTPACTVAIVDGALVADPDSAMEEAADALLSLVVLSTTKDATQLSFEGNASPTQLQEALALATQGCRAMHALLRKTLLGE